MKNKNTRITYVKLENFAPFIETMNLREFEFDRSTSKNDLVLILGANGSGKSFLLSELTPEPTEHVGNRTSKRYVSGEDGRKTLKYIVSTNDIDTDEYTCEINYSSDGKKTVCFFKHKDLNTGVEEELNANGNVSSYMELCKIHLGYDKNFKNIGYLTDEVKSIINMTYTDRNQYMSNWLPSTTEFLNASKIASKKLNLVTKEIDGLIKDISKISVGDLDDNLKTEEEKLSIKELKMAKVKDGLSKATLVQSSLAKYTKESLNQKKISWFTAVNEYNERFNKNKEKFNKYSEYLGLNGKDKLNAHIHELDIERETLSIEERNLNDEIIHLTSDIESKTIQDNKSETSGCTLVSINESILKSEEELKNIESFIAKSLNDNPDYNEFKEFTQNLHDAATSTISALTNIALISTKIENVCGKYAFKAIFESSASDDVGTQIELLKETNNSLKQQIDNLQQTLSENESQSVDFNSLKNKIPNGCTEKTCSLLAALILRARDNSNSVLAETKRKIDEANRQIEENRKLIEEKQILVQNLKNALYDMTQVVDTLKNLNGKTLYLPVGLRNEVDSPVPYNVLDKVGVLIEDARRYDEYVSLLEKKQSLVNSISNLKNISHILTMSEESKLALQNSINKRNEYSERLKTVTSKLAEINNEIASLNSLSDSIKELSVEKEELLKRYDQLMSGKDFLKKEAEYVYNSRVLTTCISGLRDLEFSLNRDILELKNKIESIKASITSIDTLKNRKENLELKKKIYETAYEVWNVRTGYPSILLKDFLDSVVEVVNKDLDKSWGGVLTLSKFKIDEGEFRIPVNRGDSELDDASVCSKAEKATINLALSCGILEVSTENSLYNICRIDELDSGMDSSRRQTYLDSITTRLKEIGCRNAFCVTHNNCFENIVCDVILLKGWNEMTNESAMGNKNILFNYNKFGE